MSTSKKYVSVYGAVAEPSDTGSLDIRIEGRHIVPAPDVDLFRDLFSSLDDFEKLYETPPLIIRQGKSVPVRYPAVDSSSSRVDPEKMLEAERFFVADEPGQLRVTRLRPG